MPSSSALERWESVTLDRTVRNVRVRARHLPDGADSETVLKHNTWDDVERDEEELQQAEALVRAQPVASEAVGAECAREAARHWDDHYAHNLRNYHDRRYLHNEFSQLQPPLHSAVIFETGCGVGNTMLPLLAAHPAIRVVGCDISQIAVTTVNDRLRREGLSMRGRAFVWDISSPPSDTELQPAMLRADLALAIFTLSALPPERLDAAFSHLFHSLRPGGQLLIRDYGRLDSKQIKFCRTTNGRIGGFDGLEWYARGDRTTAVFFTLEAVERLARKAGFEVAELRYDRR